MGYVCLLNVTIPVLLESLGVYLIFFLSSIQSLYLNVGVGNGVSLLLPFDLELQYIIS